MRIGPGPLGRAPRSISREDEGIWLKARMQHPGWPFRVFGFRETNSSMFPLYFRRTEACFIPRPNYFVALPAKKYSRRPGPDLCRANPRMEMPLSLVMAAIGAIARS